MAVVKTSASSFSLMARAGGSLAISDRCVVVSEGGSLKTLMWGSGRSSWDAKRQEIVFDDAREGQVRLKDGDIVELGGSPVEGERDDLRWIAKPHDSCPRAIWSVGTVEVVEG